MRDIFDKKENKPINTEMEGYYYTFKETVIGSAPSLDMCISHAKRHVKAGNLVMILYGTPTIQQDRVLNLTNLDFIQIYYINEVSEEKDES